MGYEAVILDEAKREFRSIIDYLCNVLESPQATAAFMDEFEHQVSLVSENPELFALSRLPELAARGYRTAHVNNYVMLYKIEGELLIIAHIFHQTQDYARLV